LVILSPKSIARFIRALVMDSGAVLCRRQNLDRRTADARGADAGLARIGFSFDQGRGWIITNE
jgi:hypothetical protein